MELKFSWIIIYSKNPEVVFEFYKKYNFNILEEVAVLNVLHSTYINRQYTLNVQKIKWDSDRIYLGGQICKINSNRYYSFTTEENHHMVCKTASMTKVLFKENGGNTYG